LTTKTKRRNLSRPAPEAARVTIVERPAPSPDR
jgi:hypothetical protein